MLSASDGGPPPPNPDCYWVEPGRLLAGAYPGHRDPGRAREKLRSFIAAGVRLFVDLTREGELQPYAPLLDELVVPGVRYRRFPIQNLDVPEPEQMRRTLDAIEAALRGGEGVYVHCWGGIGRTGTVIGCYLVQGGLDGEAAIERIAELRDGIDKDVYPSPETEEQREMVRRWAELRGAR